MTTMTCDLAAARTADRQTRIRRRRPAARLDRVNRRSAALWWE